MIKMIQQQQDVLTLTGGMWDSSKGDAICYVVEKTRKSHVIATLTKHNQDKHYEKGRMVGLSQKSGIYALKKPMLDSHMCEVL